jgi:hypothetical protein
LIWLPLDLQLLYGPRREAAALYLIERWADLTGFAE